MIERISAAIKRLMAWISQFTHVDDKNYLPMSREPFSETLPREKSIKKKQINHTTAYKDLPDLLDSLERTFDNYSIPVGDHPASADPRTIRGIKKFGALVPCYFNETGTLRAQRDAEGKDIPIEYKFLREVGFMCMSTEVFGKDERETTEDYMAGRLSLASFLFATKLKKLPWYVERKQGIPFEFGEGFKNPKHITWIVSYVVISPDGGIQFCKVRTQKSVTQSPNPKTHIHYMKKDYCNPLVDETNTDKSGRPTYKNNEELILQDFKMLAHCWKLRDYEWNVSVRRGGRRAQFSVPYKETKHFFKDRGKVVTINGRTRPIIHHVREHERIYPSGAKAIVKEHIRGLRSFTWNKFECAVSAPKFHAFARNTPGYGADIFDADNPPPGMMDVGDAMVEIAEYEDHKNVRL